MEVIGYTRISLHAQSVPAGHRTKAGTGLAGFLGGTSVGRDPSVFSPPPPCRPFVPPVVFVKRLYCPQGCGTQFSAEGRALPSRQSGQRAEETPAHWSPGVPTGHQASSPRDKATEQNGI